MCAGTQLHLAHHLVAALFEEGAALLPFALGGIGDQGSVDEDPGEAGRIGADAVQPGLGGDGAPDAGREAGGIDLAPREGREPEGHQALHRLGMGQRAEAAVGKEFGGEGALQKRLEAVVGAARRMRQAQAAGGKAFHGRDAVMRVQLRRAAAHDLRDLGVRADHGHAPGGQRQKPVVLQKDRALGPGAADQGAVLGPVVGVLFVRTVLVQRAHPRHQPQHVAGRLADLRRADTAVVHRLHQLVAAVARRTGHFQIKPGVHRGLGRPRAEPVGHDDPVITPVLAQDLCQKPFRFSGIGAVQLVVGGHDPPGPRLFHRRLEGDEIDLAQRAFVDVGGDRGALDL